MPKIKDEIKFLPRNAKKQAKTLKKAKEDIERAVFQFSKLQDFLEESSDLLKDAIADWCINIVGYGEKKLDAYSEPDNYLSCLVDIGKTVFFSYRKQVSENPKLLAITKQLAALCFPYTPALNTKFYFILEKNYLAPHIQTNYLASYFLFLKNLLIEKNIDFIIRLSCLSSALQFHTHYKKYLTNSFIEKLFFLLNSDEAKNFFLEYKQEYKAQIYAQSVYIPHYQHLTRQDKTFWKETVTNLDIEDWRNCLKEEMIKAIKADNAFIKEYKLNYFSLFNKEFDKFIRLLLLDEADIKAKELKKEIFLPTREIQEQIAYFTDSNHPLREFFSTELLDALRKKNYFKSQQLFEKYESEESTRIKCELEKRLSEQRDEYEKKVKNEQLELDKKRKIDTIKALEKKENEFKAFHILLKKFSISVQKSIKFINVIPTHPKNKNKARQQFKTEIGKLNSELKAISKLINLETKTFINDGILNALVEIEKKVKENENFDEIKINLLLQQIKVIKHVLEKTTEDINDIIQKINKIYINIDHAYTTSLDFLKSLQHGESLLAKEKKEFERRSNNINKLVNDFYDYEQTLREYKQIIALSEEQTTSIENLSLNINALKKLNSQLVEQYKACFTLKEKLKKITKPKFESTPSNVNATQTLFLFKVTSNNIQEQKTEAMATSLLPEKDNEFITNLTEHFFSTLAVVHLVSKITLGQGRANLAHIYIEKLNTYKEEIRKANINLLENESSLISIENNYIQARLYDGKRALQRLARLIDSLIPILRIYQTAAKEFYQVNFEKDTFNKCLYFFKKELIPPTVSFELVQKGIISEDNVNQKDFFSLIQELEAQFKENQMLLNNAFYSKSVDMEPIEESNRRLQELLDKKYYDLEQMNESLRNLFVAGQEYNDPNYELDINHQSMLPQISLILITAVPVITIVQPINFFISPTRPECDVFRLEDGDKNINNCRFS